MNMSRRFFAFGLALAALVSVALPAHALAAVGYGGGESGGSGGGGSSGGGGGGGATSGAGCAIGITTPAEGFSVRMSSENGIVYDRNVQLQLNGGTAARMAVSNDAAFVGASLESYSATKAWTLGEGEGVKTVYVRFYDSCGFPTTMVQTAVEFRATRPAATQPSEDTEDGQVLGERIELIDELISEVRFGQRSARVRTLQLELTRLGYMPAGWRVTDFYGTVTRAAVQRYIAQRDAAPASTDADAEIDALIARTSFGQRGADVVRLQNLLKAKGFFPASVRSTGFYFTITRDAVRRYQVSTSRS